MFSRLAELDLDTDAPPLEIVARNRERFLVPVNQPLIVLPQIQRSGGTLMTQLLDGHPQLHVHPSELHIGKPKYVWPAIDLTASPEALFDALREENARVHATGGYLKVSGAETANNPRHRDFILPFVFLEAVQRRLFTGLMRQRPPRTAREALDHYATSYFNAWLDYRGLYRAPKDVAYWVAFVARLLTREDSIERFFADYPDGYLLVSVREPVSWYASALGHNAKYRDLDDALSAWVGGYRNALTASARHPGRVLFVRFEDLVADPATVMKALAARLGIGFSKTMLQPTFNGISIVSDSSFGAKFGIDTSAIDRSGHVAGDLRRRIEDATGDIAAQLRANSAALAA